MSEPTPSQRWGVADRLRQGFGASVARSLTRSAAAVAATVWLAVYLGAIATGERVDTAVLRVDYQVLSIDALRANPLVAVWHLHTQPPLWNLLVGVCARWSPIGLSGSFYVLMAVSGAAIAWALADIAADLGLTRRWAIAVALTGSLISPVLLNAFVARYELPVAALLAWLVRAAGRSTSRTAVPLLAGAVVMTRTLYHPVWFVLVVGMWWLIRRRVVPWRPVLATTMALVALMGGWMVKNEVQVHRFTLSTWTGMNLLRSIQPAVDQGDLAALLRSGRISPVGVALPFSKFEVYAPTMSCDPGSSLEVLARPDRGFAPIPFDGGKVESTANYNYACYVAVFSQAQKDAITIIRAEPRAWIRARAWSLNNWFTLESVRIPTRSSITRGINLASRLVLLGVPHPPRPASWRAKSLWVSSDPVPLLLIVGTAVLLLAAAKCLGRKRRGAVGGRAPWSDRDVLVVVAAGIVTWTMLAGVVGELGEQYRFRTAIDPLVIVVAGSLMVARWPGSRAQVRSRSVGQRFRRHRPST